MKPLAVVGDIIVSRHERGWRFAPIGCPHGGHSTMTTAEPCAEACMALAYMAPEQIMRTANPAPVSKVVDILREALAEAERGEVQAVLVVTMDAEGIATSDHALGGANATDLIFATVEAQAAVLADLDEDESPAPVSALPRLRSVKN